MAISDTQHELVRRFDYDDRTVIVIDFGPGATPVVDILDDTAIVAIGEEEHDVDLPAGAVEAFNRNGIVTFEVRE